MSVACETVLNTPDSAPIGIFGRFLTVWVGLCTLVGIGLGHLLPPLFHTLGRWELAQVNIPVAILIWLMIVPMLLKIDFAALHQVTNH